MSTLKLTIDGVAVEAQPGMTVLQAARAAGLYIPSLCAHKDLNPYGACRLCVVEIDKVRGTPTACTTPVADGMVVRTNTEGLQRQRKYTLELMMSGHTSACFYCDAREECEQVKPEPAKAGVSTRCGTCSNRSECSIRHTAAKLHTREMGLKQIYDPKKIERDDPFIDRDHNLCVLCGICFRVCEKVHNGKGAIAIANRGKNAKISSAFDKAWSFEECQFCGACIDECPTGCLTDRWSKWFGKADKVTESVCTLCPENCKINIRTKNGKLIGTEKVSLNPEDALCAAGRFAYPQIAAAQGRLTRSYVLIDGEMIPADLDELSQRVFEIFKNTEGAKLVAVPESLSKKSRKNMRAFARHFGADFVEIAFDASTLPEETLKKAKAGDYKAAFVLGNYLDDDTAKSLGRLVCFDFLRTSAQKSAEVLIGGTLLAEADGLAKKLDTQVSLDDVVEAVSKIEKISESGEFEELKREFKSPKKLGKSGLFNRYWGHLIADLVPDMEALGLERSKSKQDSERGTYEILENELLVPNFHSIKIKAPEMAKYAKPGQFAILMANQNSERSPFTIVDWSEKEGWVQFVIEEVGRSSSELARLKKGDFLESASGPLGTPFDFSKFNKDSKVLLLGGCYGIAAIYPIARKLKQMGARVVAAIEASTAFMVFFDKKLAEVCDEVHVLTRDGTAGTKGDCAAYYKQHAKEFNAAVSVGCVFMMKQCSRLAPETEISLCALNPIMVDGTGMCGACRVSVAGDTKFACVDGPFFDLGKVDFDELAKRRTAYSLLEIDAMPRHLGGACHK